MRVLLFPSTLIGILRLILVGYALQLSLLADTSPVTVVGLLLISRLMDLADGALARRYGHVSQFGTVFDLLSDLVSHSVLWWLAGFSWSWWVIGLEWTAGIAILWTIHTGSDAWKHALTEHAPGWVRAYFRNQQRNWLCGIGVIGHFAFPALAYASITPAWVTWVWIPGFILYEVVTVYLIWAVFRSSPS